MTSLNGTLPMLIREWPGLTPTVLSNVISGVRFHMKAEISGAVKDLIFCFSTQLQFLVKFPAWSSRDFQLFFWQFSKGTQKTCTLIPQNLEPNLCSHPFLQNFETENLVESAKEYAGTRDLAGYVDGSRLKEGPGSQRILRCWEIL